ncbi:hypothetical protein DFA_10212 [Cavenderia fasciculata]|uniref:Uncharacterized protein n=1 Tax=Cavenderia fasciculata TaxID=261658 RepID=F4Q9K9_CACFS|nr:uncharacterized protein DFA_10212 [Cavenderia fasciculata]EGG15378.1 hypothetical protein DFA_10212 [Cavenderia fasciculata]|eukprot:XP_004354120.1 hypothetical protein DFA_10212 [Cavenderia fasciculata]
MIIVIMISQKSYYKLVDTGSMEVVVVGFVMTRSGGINNEYRSLQIDLSTGFYFNEDNARGKLTNDDLKILNNVTDSDQFKTMDPKYVAQLPSINSYRYVISAEEKKVGVTFDTSANYPRLIDPLVTIFERYSS